MLTFVRSAVLNPDGTPFCLSDSSKAVAQIPVYFNSTAPQSVEIVRVDLETNEAEILKFILIYPSTRLCYGVELYTRIDDVTVLHSL